MLRRDRQIDVADGAVHRITPALHDGVAQGTCELPLELHARQRVPGRLRLLLLLLLLQLLLLLRCRRRLLRHRARRTGQRGRQGENTASNSHAQLPHLEFAAEPGTHDVLTASAV